MTDTQHVDNQPQETGKENRLGKELWEWLEAIVYAVILALLIHIFILQPTRVSGESMEPTLHNKDFLIVTRWLGYRTEVWGYRYCR